MKLNIVNSAIVALSCLFVVMLTSCNDEKGGFGQEVSDDYGEYSFSREELVVEVTPDTKSFRLDAFYNREPEVEANRGIIWITFDKGSSSPDAEQYFDYKAQLDCSFNEDGTLYYDFEIYPEKIDQEVTITLSTIDYKDTPYPDYYTRADAGYDTIKVTLRPAE